MIITPDENLMGNEDIIYGDISEKSPNYVGTLEKNKKEYVKTQK